MEQQKRCGLFLDMMPQGWSEKLSEEQKKGMTELILRRDQPALLRTKNGQSALPFSADGENLEAFFYRLCDWSVHACQETLREGFVTLKDGSRVGVAGEAISDKNSLNGVKHVQSLHLRVAREIRGCAASLLEQTLSKEEGGLLLAGAPGTGKTTMLRDLCAALAKKGRSVAVVDARRELQGDQLAGCDLLLGYPKGKGMEIALRCLSPDYICVDELGTAEEAEQVRLSATGGAFPLAAVHGCSLNELLHRPALSALLDSGAFRYAAFLRPEVQGVLQCVYRRKDEGGWQKP